jgi:hypothetical protein
MNDTLTDGPFYVDTWPEADWPKRTEDTIEGLIAMRDGETPDEVESDDDDA